MSSSILEGSQSGNTGTESHMVVLHMAGNKTVKVVVTSNDMMCVLGFMKVCKFVRTMWGDIHRYIDMMILWSCLITYEF
jgi:aldehyde:ferredoxin oxidoreductase